MGVQVFRQNRWYDHKEWSNSDFKDQNLKWKKKKKWSKLEVTIWHDIYEVHYWGQVQEKDISWCQIANKENCQRS